MATTLPPRPDFQAIRARLQVARDVFRHRSGKLIAAGVDVSTGLDQAEAYVSGLEAENLSLRASLPSDPGPDTSPVL